MLIYFLFLEKKPSVRVDFIYYQHSQEASSHISEVSLIPIKNRQNQLILQNKKVIGNQPDPFQGGP